ncbi:BZ3500_MvSof-1268-A1-R1_C140g00749 [Microbotryum saponariae]|uniref:BZ3500_MvSof-1268-A1-R1_C140g00749 protein n=1 Tax=Microbotryum saponariae TaxID=289078 RepID=A0A2X0MFA0_9BASI|nr:BZ3500_MvSof-1268-A1-R1_C140g00749 [Microbotryum saponariae]
MRHSIIKMQLDFSQLQLDVSPQPTEVGTPCVDASLECPGSHTCSVIAPARSPDRLASRPMSVIARWPTRWHPSFAPNRSVTCTTILCDHNAQPTSAPSRRRSPFPRSRIDAYVTRPTSPRPAHHYRPVTISSATPHRSLASSTSIDHSNAIPHASFLIGSKSLNDAASPGLSEHLLHGPTDFVDVQSETFIGSSTITPSRPPRDSLNLPRPSSCSSSHPSKATSSQLVVPNIPRTCLAVTKRTNVRTVNSGLRFTRRFELRLARNRF